jgi:hypothetical protein
MFIRKVSKTKKLARKKAKAETQRFLREGGQYFVPGVGMINGRYRGVKKES